MSPQDHADHLLAVWQQRRNLPPEKRFPLATTPIAVSETTSIVKNQDGEIVTMNATPRKLRSHLLAQSVAAMFHASYIAGNCKSDRAHGYEDLAMQDFSDLASHLGFMLIPANIVQVGDHPPERSPSPTKIISIGDRTIQQKLDAVETEINGPLHDGAA